MYIVSVTPLKKGTFADSLSYFSNKEVGIGDIVTVPFRSKKISALVTEIEPLRDAKNAVKNAHFNLKKIDTHRGPSIFSGAFFDAARMLAPYYLSRESVLYNLLIPTPLLESYATLKKAKGEIAPRNSNIKQEKLIFQNHLDERLSWYKTYIRESFARKKSVFIVLPTFSDILLFKEALAKGIEAYTFLFHSELANKEQVAAYNALVQEPHPVLIIATAPYLIINRNDLGTVILEHESSTAYRSVKAPHVDLRLFVELWSSIGKHKLILGDTLMRVETLFRNDNHEFGDIGTPTFRINHPAKEGIVPTKIETGKINGQFQSLGTTMREMIKMVHEKNQRAFILTLRKGLSTITICRDCGTSLACEFCNAPLVLYEENKKAGRIFICTKCKRHAPSDAVCTRCGSWNLIPLGIGIEYVADEIKKHFPDVPLFRIDKETTTTHLQAERAGRAFYKSSGGILLGTEMAFPYLTDKVAYTGVASFDSLFNIPSFRTNERVVHLLIALESKAEIATIIQTRNPNEEMLEMMRGTTMLGWYRGEIEDRKRFKYPPFGTLIKVSIPGDSVMLKEMRTKLEEMFRAYEPDIFKATYRTKYKKDILIMILRPKRSDWSLPEFSPGGVLNPDLRALLESLGPAAIIEVDPENLL